jgi:hypothetical protein
MRKEFQGIYLCHERGEIKILLQMAVPRDTQKLGANVGLVRLAGAGLGAPVLRWRRFVDTRCQSLHGVKQVCTACFVFSKVNNTTKEIAKSFTINIK